VPGDDKKLCVLVEVLWASFKVSHNDPNDLRRRDLLW
jgi:hypothetical protein